MPVGHSSSYKDVGFVFVIRNIGTDGILRGARNNNSPFFMTDKAALNKCKTLNDKLKQYNTCSEKDLYKVTKYRLERLNDLYVENFE